MSDARRNGSVRVRTRHEQVEAQRDRVVLEWVARFRFVTAAALAEWSGVDVVNARRRMRRLESARLLGAIRTSGTAPLFFVAHAGRQQLGLPWRSPPRGELQRAHELATVEQVTRFERAVAAGVRVLTERECRRAEADTDVRFHVAVRGEGPRGLAQRWPDIVLLAPDGRKVAVELEFAVKHTARLQRIVTGYQDSRAYEQVLYLVDSVPLARRIAGIAASRETRLAETRTHKLFNLRSTEINVRAWDGTDQATRGAIEAAIAAFGPGARSGA
jgi:hypothetical protein